MGETTDVSLFPIVTGSMKKNSNKIVTGLTLIELSWGPSLRRWHLCCEQDKEKDPSL